MLGLVVLVAALLAVTTHSAPALKPLQVKCGQGGLTFLFWPRGHGTIRSADLGAHPAAHVEIYKSDEYSGSNLLGFVNYKRKIRFSGKCDKGGKIPVSGGIPRNKTVKKRAAISCEIGFTSELRVTALPGGAQVDLGIPDHGEARATLTKRGSSFTYDNQLCHLGAVPR
jgi:hypothetical protein